MYRVNGRVISPSFCDSTTALETQRCHGLLLKRRNTHRNRRLDHYELFPWFRWACLRLVLRVRFVLLATSLLLVLFSQLGRLCLLCLYDTSQGSPCTLTDLPCRPLTSTAAVLVRFLLDILFNLLAEFWVGRLAFGARHCSPPRQGMMLEVVPKIGRLSLEIVYDGCSYQDQGFRRRLAAIV